MPAVSSVLMVSPGQASGLLLENGGSFTVNAGGQAGNTTVGHRGTLTLAAGEI